MDELPEDHQAAFSAFVRIAQRRLKEITRSLSISDEQSNWDEIQEARYSYTNIILAAARRLSIEPFVSMDVPRIEEYNHGGYRQFTADLDHYLTQVALGNSLRSRATSTTLPLASKDRIRAHLHHLREAINAANLTDAKKALLHKRIDEFEVALDKGRFNLLASALLTVEILAIPGALWGFHEVVSKLIGNINQVVAEAKAIDDEQRQLPATPAPYAIAPPRAPEPRRGTRELDDEIPF